MFARCKSNGPAARRHPARTVIAFFLSALTLCAPLKAQSLDVAPYPLQTRPSRPIEFQKRAPALEELIQRVDMPFQILQPIPLQGVRVTGLFPKTVDILGFNYFVVVNNTKYEKMSEIYRDNRLSGKSSFVTADSIIHPYTAFSNRVLADTAVKELTPDLLLLLNAMLKVSLADYKQAEDADVREDIERNVAFLSVGIKLLNPSFQMPVLANAAQLADSDLKSMFGAQIARSAIFDRQEDFSVFKPQGWWASSGDLEGFYRCREWLSRMAYPIIDVSDGAGGNRANSFRRSVLLFRSLDTADILGKPASELWGRLIRGFSIFGTPLESWRERTLYPQDYKLVFKNNPGSLKVTLNALSEPLYRTKLMLAIRRQKPVNLGAASIFELEDSTNASDAAANFRLFPVVGEPESPWLRASARFISPEKQAAPSWPIALLDAYAWGGQQAGNILSDGISQLDPALAHALPELQHCVLKRLPGGQTQPVESRRWQVLSALFHLAPEGVPGALRTDLWLTRRIESAFAGWVDGQASIAPAAGGAVDNMEGAKQPDGSPPADPAAAPSAGSDSSAAAAGAQLRRSKIAPFHYLDPNPELFRKLSADAQKLMSDLTASGYFQEGYRSRFNDFSRLFQRLEKIAETELRGQPLSMLDKKLLGNIDLVLDKVDVPLPAVINFGAPKGSNKESDGCQFKGYNLALGHPGMLFIIFQNPRTLEWTLGRGALYTYYEMPAPLLSDIMWQHKLEAGFFKPPSWAQKFDIIQTPPPVKATGVPPSSGRH